MKNTKLIITLLVIAVLAVLVLAFGENRKTDVLENREGVVNSEDVATSTDEEILNEIMEEGIQGDTFDKLPYQSGIKPPKILTTPYTVYVGFAKEVGTSSTSIMDKEVGEVVIGYEWEALPNSQLFASVVLPDWDPSKAGDRKEYEIFVYNEDTEEYESIGKYQRDQEIDFPRDGLVGPSRFKVLGIDPGLLICPGDRSFSWQIRFTFDGSTGLVRTPITEKLPFGKTCKMR